MYFLKILKSQFIFRQNNAKQKDFEHNLEKKSKKIDPYLFSKNKIDKYDFYDTKNNVIRSKI